MWAYRNGEKIYIYILYARTYYIVCRVRVLFPVLFKPICVREGFLAAAVLFSSLYPSPFIAIDPGRREHTHTHTHRGNSNYTYLFLL